MAMTLGLSTALSGLLTAQRGLDVISQNITNVNTQGYTRKVMNQQSVVLAGQGAGVQQASIGRAVDQGLLKSIRAQTTTLGALNTQQTFFPQISDLFGQVGDATSISHTVSSLGAAFESLATSVNDPAQQYGTVQAAVSVTSQLNSMTSTLQSMRLSADTQISSAVDQVNQDLNNIYNLNQKIVRNGAVGTDTSDLMDQRDNAMNDLSKYMDIQYFQRDDGSMTIYTSSGKMLLDNTPVQLTHAASSTTDAWMSAAGGQFDKITLSNDPNTDIGSAIGGGQLRALLDIRDKTIPDLQSQLDEMASQMKNTINQISNRGSTQPAIANSFTGTRTFSTQGSITPLAGEAAATITYNNGASTITNAGYGTLDFSYSTTGSNAGQITLKGATAASLAALTPGSTFTVSGTTGGKDDSTYQVNAYDAATNTLTISKVNPVQTISLANGADSAMTLFDASGNQIATTTLNTVMGTDYTANYPGDPQAQAQPTGGPWSLDSLSKHMQSWLRAQGPTYSGATVGLDTNGHMAINLGSTVQASLAFRDQVSGTPGSTAQDATIKFDANGDGTPDQTVQGFSNFFGLNDFFTNSQPDAIMDSAVLPSNFTIPTTSPQRTLALSDPTGQIGPTMTIPAGSTLQNIADQINKYTQTNESSLQSSSSFSLASAATITVQDANGTVETKSVGPGTVTLQDIAKQLNSSTVTAQVVQDGSSSRLRLCDSRGVPLTVSISGGTLTGSTISLGNQLNMAQAHHVQASVVPDGSGYRLRLVQGDNRQLYASGNQDTSGNNVMSDLGLTTAATRESSVIGVRSDIQGNPSKMPRSAVQWNADTSQYYLSEGDNTTALQMATAMSAKVAMATAGQISAGSYTFSEHAASSVSLVSTAASNSKAQQSYQQTLQDSLNYQYTSTSGVNLDEEVANMINFQKAYTASARVISTLETMLQTLTDLVH